MITKCNISNFKKAPLYEKFSFFKGVKRPLIELPITELSIEDLTTFLKTIIIDKTENSDIRRIALETFIDFVLVGKLKPRHAVSLLLDDLKNIEETFLQIKRLKELSLFYEQSNEEIQEIYKSLKNHEEYEIGVECYYQLGLIYFYEANKFENEEDILSNLEKSVSYFFEAKTRIENRIDAKFFFEITSLLSDIIKRRYGNISTIVAKLTSLLWEQKIFLIKGDIVSPLQVGIYRTLVSLEKTYKADPDLWLDFRKQFDNLCYYFYEIKNVEVKNRLLENDLLKEFSKNILNNAIEPYLIINFHPLKKKIERRASELEHGSKEYEFLIYLKDLIEKDPENKTKKEELYLILKKNFPDRDLRPIKEDSDKVDIVYKAFNILEDEAPLSKESFQNKLITSCIDMQSRKLCKDCDENERNSYIHSLLKSSGLDVKEEERRGISSTGISAGEVDLIVFNPDGRPFTIIEAMILSSLDKKYINTHLKKIFRYDANGLPFNYILVYSNAKGFIELWKKYVKYIPSVDCGYKFKGFRELDEYKYAELKIGESVYVREEQNVLIYHIFINFAQ